MYIGKTISVQKSWIQGYREDDTLGTNSTSTEVSTQVLVIQT
jgi:hypothetical protein